MTHLLVIALVVVGAVRDLVPRELPTAHWLEGRPMASVAAALLPFAAVVGLQGFAAWWCLRRLDRRGDARAVRTFEWIAAQTRIATLPLHASAVLLFGWLDRVRAWTGDLVGVDEVLSLTPAFAVLGLSWAVAGPIERRMREALLIRRLDEGLTIPPMPRAWTWWWARVRQQLLFPAAPVVLIMAWAEAVGFVRDALWERMLVRGGWEREGTAPEWTAGAPSWMLSQEALAYGSAGLQLAGVVALLALLPVALRVFWDTAPLGRGGIRDVLEALCERYGVRVRHILVWRTHGAMVNGAVVGFLPRLRYIVLTDALLETLPTLQVEAVTAHELAHVRHRHIPWLAGGLAGSALCFGGLVALGAEAAGISATSGWVPALVLLGVLAASVLVFGWMSRVFERQADVFAAQHLTRRLEGEAAAGISEEGARVMAETLRTVSLVNGFPVDRFTFRHGSIGARGRRLRAAVGEPLVGASADRRARLAKRVVLGLVAVGLAAVLVEALGLAGGPNG